MTLLPRVRNGKPAEAPKKRVKEARQWENGGTSRDTKSLDFSKADEELGEMNGGFDVASEEEVSASLNQLTLLVRLNHAIVFP